MTQYHLHSPLTADLGSRALSTAAAIRSGKIGPSQHDVVSDLIVDLTDSAMRHYFVRPAEVFKLGLASRGMIDLGIRSTTKTIRMALKQILPRLTPDQFSQIADYLDEALDHHKTQRKPA